MNLSIRYTIKMIQQDVEYVVAEGVHGDDVARELKELKELYPYADEWLVRFESIQGEKKKSRKKEHGQDVETIDPSFEEDDDGDFV